MTFAWLALGVAATWFLCVNLAVGAIVLAVAPRLLRRVAGRGAATRAALAFSLRLAPAVVSTFVAVGLVVPAFVRYEPAGTGETVAAPLWAAMALVGLVLATRVAAASRAWLALHTFLTSARAARTQDGATVVAADHLCAALAGIVRPVVLVSRRFSERLTGEEWQAVLAHERAHATAGDNLKRLALVLTPDLLHGTAGARQLEAAWASAAEEIADAAVASRGGGVDLASALVKAARLVAPGQWSPLASGMLAGGDLAGRVERLLAGQARTAGRGGRVGRWAVLVAAAAAVGVAGSPVALHLHHLSEALIKGLL